MYLRQLASCRNIFVAIRYHALSLSLSIYIYIYIYIYILAIYSLN